MKLTAIGAIFCAILGFVAMFIPTGVAFLRGNVYKFQTLKYQLILVALNVIVSIITGLFSFLGSAIVFIGVAIGMIWSIASFIAWIYILLNAIKDTEMTILSRFGIRF